MWVHRLVAIAFHGDPPPGTECNHKNGIKADNRAENLEWISHLENVRHSIATGLYNPRYQPTQPCGAASHCAKLTEAQVFEVRALRAQGMIYREIGRLVGCSPATARDIVTGKSWSSLKAGEVPEAAVGR